MENTISSPAGRLNEKSYSLILLAATLLTTAGLWAAGRELSLFPALHSEGIILFTVMAAVTGLWVLDVPRYGRILMAVPVYYASMLALYPLITAAVIALSGLVRYGAALLFAKKKALAILRETMALMICFCWGGFLYFLLMREALLPSSIEPFQKLVSLLLSSCVIFMLLHFFTVFEKMLFMGLTFRYLFRVNAHSIRVHLAMLLPLGLLIETIYGIEPWGLLLLAPVYFMYLSIREYAEILYESRKTIEDLAVAFESRDPFTKSHSLNVSEIAGEIAREMYLEEEEIEKIRSAGKLHDLGKIGIADEILEKGKHERLTFEEYEEIRKHPETGHRVTKQLSWYKDEATYIYHHHEWYDGSGYPRGLAGEEIPMGARILAVAEACDAMASPRSYRDSVPLSTIVEELSRKRGSQFDPAVVNAFIALTRKKGMPGQQPERP